MCVVHPAAVGLVVFVVTIGVVGLVGCLSLLLTKSLSTESHCKPSSAAVDREMDVLSVNFGCLGDPRRHPISEEKQPNPSSDPAMRLFSLH